MQEKLTFEDLYFGSVVSLPDGEALTGQAIPVESDDTAITEAL